MKKTTALLVLASVACGCVYNSKIDSDIVFYSKLDSVADIEQPTVGPAGVAHGAKFVLVDSENDSAGLVGEVGQVRGAGQVRGVGQVGRLCRTRHTPPTCPALLNRKKECLCHA